MAGQIGCYPLLKCINELQITEFCFNKKVFMNMNVSAASTISGGEPPPIYHRSHLAIANQPHLQQQRQKQLQLQPQQLLLQQQQQLPLPLL